jgi:hypothetical protein
MRIFIIHALFLILNFLFLNTCSFTSVGTASGVLSGVNVIEHNFLSMQASTIEVTEDDQSYVKLIAVLYNDQSNDYKTDLTSTLAVEGEYLIVIIKVPTTSDLAPGSACINHADNSMDFSNEVQPTTTCNRGDTVVFGVKMELGSDVATQVTGLPKTTFSDVARTGYVTIERIGFYQDSTRVQSLRISFDVEFESSLNYLSGYFDATFE